MDEMDKKILRVIQKEPSLSVADLAQKVGLSHTPCWRRLKRLQADGVVCAPVTLIDPASLGYRVNVIASLRIKQHDEETLEAFEREVRNHPEIVECFSMSGESDYILRILSKSIEDYEKFLKGTLLHLPNVSSVNSSFALKIVKITTDVPIV